MDRKLHVDTLILIPTFKIHVFSYSRWTDEWANGRTDRQTEKLIQCWLGNLIGSSRLSAHLAWALLAHFTSQVRTLSILQPAPFPSAQVGRKTQCLHPTCALCFLRWNHTRCFCGAFYRQLSLDSDLTIFVLPINNTTVSKSI